ncbi:Flp family type IVb pilin [Lacisediminimonas sp.]|uniref:Flp family type IVb pilin n=1 Tax=Lacisediminimonas sp. TaxID=3060582 RepID=UPI002722A69A|nr:Flp family type IVb pilin [Lacisediminimonas sp.]MDO8300219.1 Flp family type IVb pilin [Lacisediminimonas sp.]
MNGIQRFLKDEEGAVAIEYALLAALIAIVIAVGASLLGKQLCGFFTGIATFLGAPTGTPPTTFAACA